MNRIDRARWDRRAEGAYEASRKFHEGPRWALLRESVRGWWRSAVRGAFLAAFERPHPRAGAAPTDARDGGTGNPPARYAAGTADPAAAITPPAFAPS